MDIFKEMSKEGHEQLVVSADPETGLQAIISIHSTLLGPSLGGCRFWPYKNFEAAVSDALRLSKAMTFKAAISGLNLGGGKAIICGPASIKTPELLRAFGRFVDSLNGLYFTAEDVGMTVPDLDIVREVTRYATGVSEGNGGGGDPSTMTALGVLCGMRRCLAEVSGEESFRKRTVAIQGLGKVGATLAELLHKEGAQLIVSDLDSSRAKKIASPFGAKVVSPARIVTIPCDIFSPCALGGILSARSIPKLKCRIVAGSANNQLDKPSDALRLQKRKILYAPDYVISAGGVINIACEMEKYNREKAEQRVVAISDNLAVIFARSREEGITPVEAADRMVEERLKKVRPSQPNA